MSEISKFLKKESYKLSKFIDKMMSGDTMKKVEDSLIHLAITQEATIVVRNLFIPYAVNEVKWLTPQEGDLLITIWTDLVTVLRGDGTPEAIAKAEMKKRLDDPDTKTAIMGEAVKAGMDETTVEIVVTSLIAKLDKVLS